jgi:pyrophosphatase PpaX
MIDLTAPRIRSVLFDLDGTLLHNKVMARLVLERLCQKYLGRQLDQEQIRQFRGMPTRQILAYIDPDRVEEILEDCARMSDELRHECYLYDGISNVLSVLKKAGFPMGVVTAQTNIELKGARTYFGLDEYVQVWVSSDDVECPKPDPESIFLALETLDCMPADSILIGDSSYDMEAGRRAGTYLGAALWSVEDKAELLSFNPHFVFNHPEEMLVLCEQKEN